MNLHMPTNMFQEFTSKNAWKPRCTGPNWMVFAGTVAFSFECINFVIPMYDAHDNKETFTAILVFRRQQFCTEGKYVGTLARNHSGLPFNI